MGFHTTKMATLKKKRYGYHMITHKVHNSAVSLSNKYISRMHNSIITFCQTNLYIVKASQCCQENTHGTTTLKNRSLKIKQVLHSCKSAQSVKMCSIVGERD